MARKTGRTVPITFVTTYAGFFSVGPNGIEVLSQFGLVASTGLLFNVIVTILFIPAILSLAGHWRIDGRTKLIRGALATLVGTLLALSFVARIHIVTATLPEKAR